MREIDSGPDGKGRRAVVEAPDPVPVHDLSPPPPAGQGRDTSEVLDDHLECRQQGDVAGDLERNYDDHVLLLSGCGVHRGHDGVRRTASILHHYLGGGGGYEITNRLVEADVAFIEWRSHREGRQIHDGADSFLIRGGRIVVQTIHYTVDLHAGDG
jgi:hypothetical protein